jgi:type VI secretion system secreted protein Hcp
MASDYLLVIDGIQGESLDDKRPNSIEVESFTWGHQNDGSAAAGTGAGSGRVEFKDIKFTSYVSRASPELAKVCASGKHIKKAQLFVRKQGQQQQEYYVITLEDFIVSAFDSGGISENQSGVPGCNSRSTSRRSDSTTDCRKRTVRSARRSRWDGV